MVQVKPIIRKIRKLDRMMEIIKSMKKPQITYILNNRSINPTIEIQAQATDGICLYQFYNAIGFSDNKFIEELRSMPREYFKEINKFKGYKKNVITRN